MVYQITSTDARYPTLLENLEDKPAQIFVKGSVEVLSASAVAVVGTRMMTAYGRAVTRMLVRDLVGVGFAIVSGLALGVDGEAHRAALAAGGKTIAVLAHGLDRVSPVEHRSLAGDILSNGGALVSEFPEGVDAQKYTFVRRNRIIAGMSLGVLVTEAGSKSGAKITARWAADFGRPVFAVPGPITNQFSEGTKELVNIGAKLVSSVADITEEVRMENSVPARGARDEDEGSEIERITLAAISAAHGSATMATLARVLERPIEELQEPLLMLELRGKIHCVGSTFVASD